MPPRPSRRDSRFTLGPGSSRFTACLNRLVVANCWTRVDLAGPGNAELGLIGGFFPVGNPPWHATDGEHDREHTHGNPDRSENDARVEVNVGVEVAFLEVIIRKRS